MLWNDLYGKNSVKRDGQNGSGLFPDRFGKWQGCYYLWHIHAPLNTSTVTLYIPSGRCYDVKKGRVMVLKSNQEARKRSKRELSRFPLRHSRHPILISNTRAGWEAAVTYTHIPIYERALLAACKTNISFILHARAGPLPLFALDFIKQPGKSCVD